MLKFSSLVFLVIACAGASPEERRGVLSLEFAPGVEMPLFDKSSYYTIGASGRLAAAYSLGKLPVLPFLALVDYGFLPDQAAGFVSFISAEAGIGFTYEFLNRLSFLAHCSAGYQLAVRHGTLPEGSKRSGGGTSVSGGLRLAYVVTPALNLGAGVVFKHYFGIYTGISLNIGASLYLGDRQTRVESIRRSKPVDMELLKEARTPRTHEGVKLREIDFSPVYPVFHKYYDDHPIGKAVLHNIDDTEISDIRLSLFINDYMDAPRVLGAPASLGPGAEQAVELYALLNRRVMGVTAATKVSAELTLDFVKSGVRFRDSQTTTVRLLDRNALTWDDDRKACAFVTSGDPAVLSVSKGLAGMVRASGNRSMNQNLRTAVAVHEALRLMGVGYVADPKTPYAELSATTDQVDTLQFPAQTLGYGAGDCDDLSILYCALLEAVGIDAAFITVPGHIFIAFSTGIGLRSLDSELVDPDMVIVREDGIWIPVETTMRDGGFAEAWRSGVEQWKRYDREGSARLYTMREAWDLYEPVGIDDEGEAPAVPLAATREAYLAECTRYLDQLVRPQIVRLESSMKERGETPALRNKLGVLYARYGNWVEAERIFADLVERSQYPAAAANLGNMYFQRREMDKALQYLQLAHKAQGDSPSVTLQLARTYYELGEYQEADRLYADLKKADAELASRYTYLDAARSETARASSRGAMEGVVEWTVDAAH